MKKIMLIALGSLLATNKLVTQVLRKEMVSDTVPLPQSPVIEVQEEIFKIVEFTTEFPGGEQAFLEYLNATLRYPKYAIDMNVQGKVVVKFIVERDGSIMDVEIIEDIGAGCGAEALRVICQMPKWSPGRPRGRPTRTQFFLTVEFMLHEGKHIKTTQLNLKYEHIPAMDYGLPADEKLLYRYVEYPPMFPGCEAIEKYVEQEKCAGDNLQNFINKNLKYPRKARRKGIEGTVYVRLVIENDGSISNAKLMSEIGEGCGSEALRIVSLMPKWNPGKHRGIFIRYLFTLPIEFKIK